MHGIHHMSKLLQGQGRLCATLLQNVCVDIGFCVMKNTVRSPGFTGCQEMHGWQDTIELHWMDVYVTPQRQDLGSFVQIYCWV